MVGQIDESNESTETAYMVGDVRGEVARHIDVNCSGYGEEIVHCVDIRFLEIRGYIKIKALYS